MHSLLITLTIIAAIALVHYSYVDFRFRHVEGILWFWLSKPAPRLLWVSRAAIASMLVLTLATLLIGRTTKVAAVLVALFVVHIGTLIAMEIRYGR